jgi:type I restriction enzyme S subunit
MSFPRYPKYKDSGVEWFYEVPESWEVRRIKHLGNTITGGTPKTDEPEYWTHGDVPWLPSGKVQNGTIHKEDADTFITKRALAESAAKLIKPSSALIALTGATCGNAAFLAFQSTANQSVVGIEPKPNSDGRFIYYSLLAQREQVLTHKSGGAQGGINQEDVRNLLITTPEKVEQTAIAEFLDRETGKIDELVAEQRRLMELLKEKRQAVISHAVTKGLKPHAPMVPSGIEWLGDVPVGWEVGPLKRYWSVTDCKHITAEFVDDGIPLASIREVQSRWVALANAKCTTKYFYELLIEEGRRPLPGDLIFSRNATVGEVAQVHAEHPPFAMGQDVVLLRKLSPKYSSDYLQYVIRSPIITEQLANMMIGSTFKRINVAEIRSFIVPLPPHAEQAEISEFIEAETAKFDALTAEAQRAIDLLQERRTALISAAVTGQIDVRHQPRN